MLTALLLWLSVVLLDHGVWQAHHTIGAAIVIPALALWATARYQLGDAFTGRAEARRLVTHGVYARMRNPIYVSAELLTIGLVVFLGWWWLLLLLLVTVPLQIRRARRESRVLEDAFGDEYRAYRARTWF